MAIKDVLLALTTYPEPTPVSAVDEAIDFAAAIGARISAIACEVKIRAPGIFWPMHCSTFQRWLRPRPRRVRLTPKIFWSHSKTLRRSVEYSKSGYWSIV